MKCINIILSAWILILTSVPAFGLIVGHEAADEFPLIEDAWFGMARGQLRIFYSHSSHGSQPVTGMEMLALENPAKFSVMPMIEGDDDLGLFGALDFVDITHDHLANHPETNVVIWSWCSGATENTPEQIDIYLQAMTQLESEYPGVVFVYMTGHLTDEGPTPVAEENNDRIRAYAVQNDKVLYDFADIESYDPDGYLRPDANEACSWCESWCASHDCPPCDYCAHTHCFNCYRKGQAFWNLLVRLVGWDGSTSSVGELPTGARQLAGNWPNPFNPSTTIAFDMKQSGWARLTVVDGAGRMIAELLDGPVEAGRVEKVWTGRDQQGQPVASGHYLYRLETADGSETMKMTLLK